MDIVKEASRIKKAKARQHSKDLAEGRKKLMEEKSRIEYLQNLVLARLKRNLHGKGGFMVKEDAHKPGIFGEIADIRKGGETLGTVCVNNENYTFRGSDESPEQTCSRTVVRFAKIVNNHHDLISLTIKQWPAQAVDESITEFERRLAAWIAEDANIS